MFGFVAPDFENLSENNKQRYRSVYCGLCHSLRDNYSQFSRLTLSYDLTFLVLLLSSLYEPKETQDWCNCLFHPGKKYKTSQNIFSDYCADLNVALAYHKIKDDIQDDKSLKSKISEKALSGPYKKVKEKYPQICEIIECTMKNITKIECEGGKTSGDELAKNFGIIMASIFAPYDDVFSFDLRKFGANLGRFIYFMDAAFDLVDDLKTNSYNPFIEYVGRDIQMDKETAEIIKKQLMTFAGMATESFEKLPLEQDIDILNNILYEGIWTQFNKKFLKA